MLNVNAKEFTPAAAKAAPAPLSLPDDLDLFASPAEAVEHDLPSEDSEEGITEEQLTELEAVENWVEQMARCEEEETLEIILYALEHAPPELVEQIEARAAAMADKAKKGGKPKASRFHTADA